MNTTEQIASLQSTIDALQSQVDMLTLSTDDMWLIVSATFVFFMQAGFALLEAGSARSKNTINILFKNVLDAAIGAIAFWLLGYGFAYGEDKGGFIGGDLFGLNDKQFTATDDAAATGLNFASWYFQWTFSATAATVVSGALCERCKLEAYFVYSFLISLIVYPVVAHWCWGTGWLSPWGADANKFLFDGEKSNNFIDFAGSAVVHMVGGFSATVGAYILGPRKVSDNC
jgi:Amt family ammonium transporter